MGTISEKLQYTLSAKNAISGAIEAKGVSVDNAPLSGYAELIAQIETGGSSDPSSPYIENGLLIIPSGLISSQIVYPYTPTSISVISPITISGYIDEAIEAVQLSATVSNGGSSTFSSSDIINGLTLTSGGLITGIPTATSSGSGIINVSYMNVTPAQIILNYSITEHSAGPYYEVNGTLTGYDGNYFQTDDPPEYDHYFYKHESQDYYLTFDSIMGVWVISATKYSGGPGTYAFTTYQENLPTEGNPQDLDGGGTLSYHA